VVAYPFCSTLTSRQDAQVNNDAFHALALRAKDIVLAVARACEGMQDMAAELEADLRQLTKYVASRHRVDECINVIANSTMNDILAFASEKILRKRYKKLWNRSEDSAAVKALNTQLNHAFQLFEVSSYISKAATTSVNHS